MPKRKREDDKINKYLRKIQRLKERKHRRGRRSRSPSYIDDLYDSDANYRSDADTTPSKSGEQQPDMNSNLGDGLQEQEPGVDIPTEIDLSEVTLDNATLQALGKPLKEKLKYGPNINGDLAKLWSPILKNGLGDYKERQQLLEKYMVPNNCQLLQAPKLNPEIIATISEKQKNRDKKIGEEQQQLGHGITALNRALSLLATNTGERATIINMLSEASQILSDLHHNQTQSRKKLITPILDKKFLDLIKEAERDDYLYGSDLSEKIKALKYAQKSSHSIKKTYKKPAYNQENYRGPPRYQYQSQKPYNRSGQKRQSYRSSHYKNHSYNQTKKAKPEGKPPARK